MEIEEPWLGDVNESLEELGIRRPRYDPYPAALRRFMDKLPVEESVQSLLEKFQEGKTMRVFITPSRQENLFPSTLVHTAGDLLELPKEAKVWVVPELSLVSEFLLFMDAQGNLAWIFQTSPPQWPLRFPDSGTVKKLLNAAKVFERPAVLSVGVAEFPERPESIRWPTILLGVRDILFTDGFGIPSELFASLRKSRWDSLVSRSFR